MTKNEMKAVIWDMDGVIADTAKYHLRGWQIVLHKKGIDYTEEDFWRNTGKRNDTIIRQVLGEDLSPKEITAIAEEKNKTFRQLMGQNVEAFPGVFKLLTSLKKHNFKIAIASSSPMESILLIIRSINIHSYFDSITSGWEVTRGKPDPQTFLLAAEKLGVVAKNCVVIEDAISGVTASKKAKMSCIAVTNTTSREELRKANIIVDSLEEITIDDIERLLKQHE